MRLFTFSLLLFTFTFPVLALACTGMYAGNGITTDRPEEAFKPSDGIISGRDLR